MQGIIVRPRERTQTKIDVRFGDLHIPQDFIVVDSSVCEVVAPIIGLSEEEGVFSLWDYVCREIEYPEARQGLPPDRHVLQAFPYTDVPFFGRSYRINKSNDEFWHFPWETLGWRDDKERRWGDCDDTSILLASLLRAYGIAPERLLVVVGEIPAGRHCWVELDGRILETTLSSAPNPAWRSYSDYSPSWAFNDGMRVGEICFVPRGDERQKLRWIGQRWQHPTKL